MKYKTEAEERKAKQKKKKHIDKGSHEGAIQGFKLSQGSKRKAKTDMSFDFLAWGAPFLVKLCSPHGRVKGGIVDMHYENEQNQ